MFKTVIGCLPKNKLILYNLGLNEGHKKALSAYENVEIRPFPFKNYSHLPHVKNLHTYAWKPIIVMIVSMEYDIIMYGDSSVRLLSCLTAALQHLYTVPNSVRSSNITKHGSTWYIGMAHVPRHRFHTFEKSQYHFHFQSEPSFVTTTK